MSGSAAPALHGPQSAVQRAPSRQDPDAHGISDRGLLRETNEDAYAVVSKLGFYAVADGVGGNPAGDVASRMVVDAVADLLGGVVAGRPDPGDPQCAAWQATFASSLLAGAVRESHALVRSAADGNPALKGMATTFTGLLLLNDRAVIAHVGDSRCYHLRNRRLCPLTEDHTWAAECVRTARMTPEEAATSPLRGSLMRAVGFGEAVNVDERLIAVEPGDTFLLATDGLHGLVDDAAIERVLLCERDLIVAAERLVELALDAGGHDNVTLVLVRVG